MLSILQKQARQLEAELRDRQRECLSLKQQGETLEERITAQDERIKELEAKLSDTQHPEGDMLPPEEAAAPALSDEETAALSKLVDELRQKLSSSEGKLTMSELRASVLDFEKCTQRARHVMEQFLKDKEVLKLKEDIEKLEHENARLRGLSKLVQAKDLELAQGALQVQRRDEQIEYLMQVHDASCSYDWVRDNQIASGSASRAASVLSVSSSSPHLRDGAQRRGSAHYMPHHQDSVAILEGLGIDTQLAVSTLESTGNDLQNAIAILFPA